MDSIKKESRQHFEQIGYYCGNLNRESADFHFGELAGCAERAQKSKSQKNEVPAILELVQAAKAQIAGTDWS